MRDPDAVDVHPDSNLEVPGLCVRVALEMAGVLDGVADIGTLKWIEEVAREGRVDAVHRLPEQPAASSPAPSTTAIMSDAAPVDPSGVAREYVGAGSLPLGVYFLMQRTNQLGPAAATKPSKKPADEGWATTKVAPTRGALHR